MKPYWSSKRRIVGMVYAQWQALLRKGTCPEFQMTRRIIPLCTIIAQHIAADLREISKECALATSLRCKRALKMLSDRRFTMKRNARARRTAAEIHAAHLAHLASTGGC